MEVLEFVCVFEEWLDIQFACRFVPVSFVNGIVEELYLRRRAFISEFNCRGVSI